MNEVAAIFLALVGGIGIGLIAGVIWGLGLAYRRLETKVRKARDQIATLPIVGRETELTVGTALATLGDVLTMIERDR